MAEIWPGNTKCTVMLSFDLDGASALLHRTPEAAKHPSRVSASEFGPNVGVHRILDLLDRYEIPASFFVPGWIAERNEDTVRDIVRRGHEIGHHGYMHEPPGSMDADEEAEVLDRGVRILEEIAGRRPLGYRSPSWELTQHSLGFLAERGFVYDSSLMGHDAPYFVDSPNGRLVEIPVSWSLDDAPYYAFSPGRGSMNTPGDVYEAWEWEFDGAYQYGTAFILTMHPHISGRLARLQVLERLIRYIRGHDHVAFERHIDVAESWRDNERE